MKGQVERLKFAGFPEPLITSVLESLVKEVKAGGLAARKNGSESRERPVPIPYVHQLSHRLKKVAKKCGVHVVFTAPNKLVRMCAAVNGLSQDKACKVSHATRFVPCRTAVVYKIPLSCGRCYVGQTGRCINVRLREHRAAVKALAGGGHLADHCRRCSCSPYYEKTSVLRSFATQGEREIFEALIIKKEADAWATFTSTPRAQISLNPRNPATAPRRAAREIYSIPDTP